MTGGWYKQQRNIPERAWFKDANVVLLYTYLKATAYVVDGMYKGQLIRRGSCPTTRADMMEATGLKRMTLDRCLKKLIGFGEIIVKSSNQFSIVNVCDYDSFGVQESLFDAADGIASGIADGIASGIADGIASGNPTPINIKEDKNNNNLISPYSPYKKERENSDVALEVKKRFNKEFSGILPPCLRLSTATRISVEECLRRFGLQSVDVVFAQIKTEQFSLGNNKTGFIANFSFIFTPRNYQQYIERAQLARQKKEAAPSPSVGCAAAVPQSPEPSPSDKRRQLLLSWIAAEEQRPTARGQELLKAAHDNGEMSELNIDWKPNNE